MAVRIQLRNDTDLNWTNADPVLAAAYPVSPTGILFDFLNTDNSTAKNATGGFWKLYGLY